MSFKDLFSKQSKVYAISRPNYPEELFKYLSSLTPEHKLAWDCATGNGQAAISLTNYYEHIIATDASKQQIEHAQKHEKITYKVCQAENCGLSKNSVDLVTVATAVHWFDLNIFYPEVNRVLKEDGFIAVWGYGYLQIDPNIDFICNERFVSEILGNYWAEEAKLLWLYKYQTIDFPFEEIKPPSFKITLDWDFQQLMNFFNSWSAVQNYISKYDTNPVELIYEDLKNLWGDLKKTKKISWDLILRVGKKK